METAKKLTRIKLINWHYFANETLDVNGSFLISGDNGSGKSTVLDAIQMVLTTNSRRFNPAANEKSKRDLKGYVRCKTGEEGNIYARTGAVISYVALEFFEPKRNRTFVMGAKLDSPDLEADIVRKWFVLETNLDRMNFLVDNKPARDEQFTNNGKRIQMIRSASEARDQFKRRLGQLDNRFIDLVPKSLAFKPIDNVKDFINKYILSERPVEVGPLRENIRNLREMQVLLDTVRKEIAALERILAVYDQIQDCDEKILVIQLLMLLAEEESIAEKLTGQMEANRSTERAMSSMEMQIQVVEDQQKSISDQLREIEIRLATDDTSRMIAHLKEELDDYEDKKRQNERDIKELKNHTDRLLQASAVLHLLGSVKEQEEINRLRTDTVSLEEKNDVLNRIDERMKKAKENLYLQKVKNELERNALEKEMVRLEAEIRELENKRIIYPENSVKLKKAIEAEFANRGIQSEVRIFADLLEINDVHWQNAVEGYLNTQRFSVLVEPQYYDIASEVYDAEKKKIHSAMLVNVRKLMGYNEVENNSLASVVTTENRYARAYANYLLNRVVRCDSVGQLKEYNVAITADCMLYQGHTLRKINPEIYHMPYIGRYALQKQLEIKRFRYQECADTAKEIRNVLRSHEEKLMITEQVHFDILYRVLNAPSRRRELDNKIRELKSALKEAENDPTIIEWRMKEDEIRLRLNKLDLQHNELLDRNAKLKNALESGEKTAGELKQTLLQKQEEISVVSVNHQNALAEARRRYDENKHEKTSERILINYGPRRKTLENQKAALHDTLLRQQIAYREGELGSGEEVIDEYRDEYRRLTKQDLLKYEERLRLAKDDCEIEFRESFLARMRENIQSAHNSFRELNKSLRNVRYGNDSYRFIIEANRQKKSLYDMINSDMNVGDDTLFSSLFETDYQQEMDELFNRLTEADEKGEMILNEYTDYRSYLDYDIQIEDLDGRIQYFSRIYGEKSGGETQTPYYVAIAASFQQIYGPDSIRIVMLDEAFDKMDDERITSMMKFFKACGFQMILASPPAKMEIIGEYVDTILVAYHEGNISTIERYLYEEL